MNDRRFIKPRDGLAVQEPDGTPLPPHGKGVAWDTYWQRRLDQGDVEPTTEAAVKRAVEPADKGEKK
jgi:hypothetical protein